MLFAPKTDAAFRHLRGNRIRLVNGQAGNGDDGRYNTQRNGSQGAKGKEQTGGVLQLSLQNQFVSYQDQQVITYPHFPSATFLLYTHCVSLPPLQSCE